MTNRYFSIIDKIRLKKFESEEEMNKEFDSVYNFLKYNSPSYDELYEIAQFIKLLESSFFYPNKKQTLYYKDSFIQYKTPIVVSLLEKQIDIELNCGLITGIDQSRYSIKISLLKDKYIEISIIDTDTKKVTSKTKFRDGCAIVNEQLFEHHLYISILDILCLAVQQLLRVYCNKIDWNGLEEVNIIEKEEEHINEVNTNFATMEIEKVEEKKDATSDNVIARLIRKILNNFLS